MNEQLHAINIMRKRLDEKLQMYWSEMFALKYESSWSASMQARTILEYGQSLITFCKQINVLNHAAANRLHKAWAEAYDKHKEMQHCRDARVVHQCIPEVSTEGVLQYFFARCRKSMQSFIAQHSNVRRKCSYRTHSSM